MMVCQDLEAYFFPRKFKITSWCNESKFFLVIWQMASLKSDDARFGGSFMCLLGSSEIKIAALKLLNQTKCLWHSAIGRVRFADFETRCASVSWFWNLGVYQNPVSVHKICLFHLLVITVLKQRHYQQNISNKMWRSISCSTIELKKKSRKKANSYSNIAFFTPTLIVFWISRQIWPIRYK